MAVVGRTTVDAVEELTSPKSIFVRVWYVYYMYVARGGWRRSKLCVFCRTEANEKTKYKTRYSRSPGNIALRVTRTVNVP